MMMVSNFDMIPFKDTIYAKIQENEVTFEPINYNFSLYGVDSQIFIMNMVDVYLVVMTLIGFFVIYKVLKSLLVKYKHPRLKK